MKSKASLIRRGISLVLCLAISCALIPATSTTAEAANKTLQIAQARTMAVAASYDITKVENQIILKRVKYVEAVEGIQAKMKNLTSFRWSPLLSFSFPEQPDMVESFEFVAQPLILQGEIDTLVHEAYNLRYEVLAEVNTTFTDVYMYQEKVAFTQELLDSATEEYERNSARLLTGDAVQSDIDAMEKNVNSLTTELASLMRSFETSKSDLSDLINLDVTTQYTFRSPLESLTLPRSELESVVQYTLANDQLVYETQMTESTALLTLTTYESLMKNQYGGKMSTIQGYINMAKTGQEIDYSAFQLAYKSFLTQIDEPWSGSVKIIFFKFPKEWFKGEIDGTRYIEDELYAIYTACMDYANAKKDTDNILKETRSTVESSFESLVTTWNSYETLLGLMDDSKDTLDKVTALNKLGLAEYTEVQDAQTSYQDAQLDAMDTLAAYNILLYEFDALTCGAVTKYMNGEDISTDTGGQGDSFSVIDPIEDPYYYIYTTVEDLTFHVGVSIPDDFEPAISAYEVWSDDYQIGTRTEVGEEISHLTLDYGSSDELTFHFYLDDTYVQSCVVVATVPRAILDLEGDVVAEAEESQIGSFTATTTAMSTVSTTTLSLDIDASVGASKYLITYGDYGNVYTSGTLSLIEDFTYLALLIQSLDTVTLSLYDSSGEFITSAWFDSTTQSIWAITE